MTRSCLDGYLTNTCAECEFWRDGTDGQIGCGCPFPIMHCEAFAEMYNNDTSKEANEDDN